MRIITYTNAWNWKGTIALAWSLIKNSALDEIKLTVTTDEKIDEKLLDQLRAFIDFDLIDLRAIGHFEYTGAVKEERYRGIIQKMMVLALPYEEKLYYIDTDIICMRSLQAAQDFDHLTVCPAMGGNLNWTIMGHPWFSTGAFIYRASRALLDDMQAFVKSESKPFLIVEEEIFNRYFWSHSPEIIHLLSPEWMGYKQLLMKHPAMWKRYNPRLVHFAGKKPWIGSERGCESIEAAWSQLYHEALKAKR